MFNKDMYELGNNRSVIRELFEYGKLRARELGEDKVYDFSLGNPSVPAPREVNDTIKQLIDTVDSTALHGYTSAQGDLSVRKAIAQNLNNRFASSYSENDIYMTCGAAAGLAISIKALCEADDRFMILAPHFPEYTVFVKSAGGTPVTVPFDGDFQIDFDALSNAITEKTKGIIVNSPNNPSGVIYTRETLIKLSNVLTEAATKFGHPIFIIADEPYRELVYDGAEVPFIPAIYKNTIVCYSFSKSLSLPGERIGYLAINPVCDNRVARIHRLGSCRRFASFQFLPCIFGGLNVGEIIGEFLSDQTEQPVIRIGNRLRLLLAAVGAQGHGHFLFSDTFVQVPMPLFGFFHK